MNIQELQEKHADIGMDLYNLILGFSVFRWIVSISIFLEVYWNKIEESWFLLSWTIVTLFLILQAWWATCKYRRYFARSYRDVVFLCADALIIHFVGSTLFPTGFSELPGSLMSDSAFMERLPRFYGGMIAGVLVLGLYSFLYVPEGNYKPISLRIWLARAVAIVSLICGLLNSHVYMQYAVLGAFVYLVVDRLLENDALTPNLP